MTKTAIESGAYLHHIHLHSPDPGALARFYADTMDMPDIAEADGAFIVSGPRRQVVFSAGPARKLAAAAFACRDQVALAGLFGRAEDQGLSPQPAKSPLLDQGAFAVRDPDGNQVVFGLVRPGNEIRPVSGTASRAGIHGPIQHLTLASQDIAAIEGFYAGKLGFAVSDRVRNEKGEVTTCFMRSNHEHHTLACFLHRDRNGIDHHSYEAGDFMTIRDWADRFSEREIKLMWGPGRHGPGNNLFIFITDPDGNWIEVSAELETVYDRPVQEWPHVERTLNLWGDGLMRA
ncbi:hypothetical protein FNJ84_20535 [Paracoccus sp. M683]|uniref:VOC family protein n=1 Tax=Paracoccus sp. M683 TaxID=2594268 RepID=UPI00117FFE15|nr:VOC family protein [Paracoccus sp. M683]TRW93038.1 hypothetical protein FNJ84_20535 [Paracoccus sp. M683]